MFHRRFGELEAKRVRTSWHKDPYGDDLIVKTGEWQGWATSALSLIRAVFGEASEQYESFSSALKNGSGSEHSVRTLHNLFISAKEDFEGGYVFNVELRVSGEVFGDFVGLARTALSEGHKDVAAVLACAALEDALKRYAIVNELNTDNKSMTDVVNALKSAGLIAGAQKALLDRMPTIRNYALHANWEKISEPDVGSVIGFVEQFLLTKFNS
ncbi:MAG: DUF4145 domain-containing protein [Massilia sp.]|uniref:DUF4145 domain-containing protein n=1 Tax=Massilia sp. TaxID=1882437 RepID=UPI002FC5FFB6